MKNNYIVLYHKTDSPNHSHYMYKDLANIERSVVENEWKW